MSALAPPSLGLRLTFLRQTEGSKRSLISTFTSFGNVLILDLELVLPFPTTCTFFVSFILLLPFPLAKKVCLLMLLTELACAQSSWLNHTNILTKKKKRTNRNTPKAQHIHQVLVGVWLPALKASSDVASLGSGPCPWFFADPALLNCWPSSALLAGCCEMGPCQGGTVLSLTVTCTLCLRCSCCSLTLYFPSLLLSLLLLSYFENLSCFILKKKKDSNTSNFRSSPSEIVFHLLLTKDNIIGGQMLKVSILKNPLS